MQIEKELYNDGRITIPIEFRREFNMEKGDALTFRAENGVLQILTKQQLLEEARAAVREFVPDNVSLTEELFAMRREELAKEQREADAWKTPA